VGASGVGEIQASVWLISDVRPGREVGEGRISVAGDVGGC